LLFAAQGIIFKLSAGMELELIFLGVASVFVGVIFIFAEVMICSYFKIDMLNNIWLLGIPAILSIALNICFLELYRKHKRKRKINL
jgi:hypothetical protein